MMRGKLGKPVEFGAKLSVSLSGEGLAHTDHLRWDAFHEGLDLVTRVEAYLAYHGHYPERVLADPIYGTRTNRDCLKQRAIRFAGKPLGWPKRETDANRGQLKHDKEQRRQGYLQPILNQREIRPGQTRLPAQLHSRQACQHLVRLDQHHLLGHETAGPAKDLFCSQPMTLCQSATNRHARLDAKDWG
jgi:hypothetical protein